MSRCCALHLPKDKCTRSNADTFLSFALHERCTALHFDDFAKLLLRNIMHLAKRTREATHATLRIIPAFHQQPYFAVIYMRIPAVAQPFDAAFPC